MLVIAGLQNHPHEHTTSAVSFNFDNVSYFEVEDQQRRKNFHTVYHQNGQQTIDLQGDKAEAISYCRVILIGKQNDKEMKTTLYTIYKDNFVKENGKWFINHRTSNFVHQEVEEIK